MTPSNRSAQTRPVIAFLAVLTGLAWVSSSASSAKPTNKTCDAVRCAGALVFVGTQQSGAGGGIVSARLDQRSGKLEQLGLGAEIARPTWIAADPGKHVLYSVSETGNDGKSQASVSSFRTMPDGRLELIGSVSSGGGGATHLQYSPSLHMLYVANYGTGQVSAMGVAANGKLQQPSSTVSDNGRGPGKRQQGPHAHGVAVDPSARFLLVPDLGADRVFFYRLDSSGRTLVPSTLPFAQLPAGSGPRHLLFSRDGRFAFLDTELSAQVVVFRWKASAGSLTPVETVDIDPPGYAGDKSAAEIAISDDGHFLYVSNRGENQLIVYRIGRAGTVHEIQRVGCGGDVPWSFTLSPDGHWLVVANQKSNSLASFRVNPATGLISDSGQRMTVATPTSVAFVK